MAASVGLIVVEAKAKAAPFCLFPPGTAASRAPHPVAAEPRPLVVQGGRAAAVQGPALVRAAEPEDLLGRLVGEGTPIPAVQLDGQGSWSRRASSGCGCRQRGSAGEEGRRCRAGRVGPPRGDLRAAAEPGICWSIPRQFQCGDTPPTRTEALSGGVDQIAGRGVP